ncbi:sugar phosphate isomerase/epimerase [Castellaniella sp.]|uniref:sugar phosphate isomerase/epimerase family protein n=1 Tax=Castellaniella sp. TaxID=1955812 RepID=UPI0025BCFCB5|nr:sugar phosphate isomerase/epimerase family protein [Castellaniella sp.]
MSYSTFGLTGLSFLDAIDAVDKAGYEGVELAFHRRQFNPFDLDDESLAAIRKTLTKRRVKPACIATASHFFTPSRPHEPSLLSPDLAGRKRRIDLIRRGIRVARSLRVSLVTFGSGFLRDEHVASPLADPREILIESIRECLREIRDDEDITLLIEPEPGMYIETVDQALSLIAEIGSPRFRLHLDLCHAYCSETDYGAALGRAAPMTRYLHLSDAAAGYNLKIMNDGKHAVQDPDFASTLVYFQDTADFLLVDREHPLYFCDQAPSNTRRERIGELLHQGHVEKPFQRISYPDLYAGSSVLDDEIFTYLISVPGLSFDVLERARPIIMYLRGAHNPPLVDRMVANTLTGIVHFHEIPGKGTLDFSESFRVLSANGFSGYGSVELYHHVQSWEEALSESLRHLSQCVA